MTRGMTPPGGDGRLPAFATRAAAGRARGVALVLHGGAEYGSAVVRPWRLAYLRMVPVARALSAAGSERGLEVRLLRNRVRGWNEPLLDPVRDARWALRTLRAERPEVPIVLVGHSMGGRVALRVADDPHVTGVCALAPWTPSAEPVEPVRGRSVVVAHGTDDRVTMPDDSRAYAGRAAAVAARLARFEIASEGHAMLRRAGLWHRLVAAFTLDALGLRPAGGLLERAWLTSGADRLRIRV